MNVSSFTGLVPLLLGCLVKIYNVLTIRYSNTINVSLNNVTRLCELASARLRHNNPAIADLSDQNRATKLAEKLSELYDNEWTDTFEAAKEKTKKDDQIIAESLRDILKVVVF